MKIGWKNLIAANLALWLISCPVLSSEKRDMENIAIVEGIYDALNTNDIEKLKTYLAEEVKIIPLYRPETIDGIDAVSDSLKTMLSIAKDTNIVFKSGPIPMGDVVSVEYTHHYKLDGASVKDHNVSILIIPDGKVTKWIGYIHPKSNDE